METGTGDIELVVRPSKEASDGPSFRVHSQVLERIPGMLAQVRSNPSLPLYIDPVKGMSNKKWFKKKGNLRIADDIIFNQFCEDRHSTRTENLYAGGQSTCSKISGSGGERGAHLGFFCLCSGAILARRLLASYLPW